MQKLNHQIDRPCRRMGSVAGWLAVLGVVGAAWGQPQLNVVGTWGGAVNAVFVDEAVNPDIAYVGSGRRLVILNVADPTNILELGSIDLEATVLDMAVRDGLAFVGTADAPNFFCVVDVSNLSNPQLVWHSLRRTGMPREIELYGSLAYVRFDEDLHVFDIGNPTAPVYRGKAIFSIVESVEVEGDLMFIGSDPPEPRQLRIYDLTIDPINVGSSSLIGWLELPARGELEPKGLAVDGNHAYMTLPFTNGTFAAAATSSSA